jgi:G3E family GTPase
MRVYILGGFLGSGKTSLLMKLTSMYIDKGQRVTLLVNESGDVGVDGTTLKREGYDVVEMPNGCICCTLSISLQDGIQHIVRDIDPDIIIIEPTGLALPHKVKEIVSMVLTDQEEIIIIGVVDVQRFEDLIKKKEDFFKKQIQGSDFILINKSDLTTSEKMKEVSDWISLRFPDKEILSISIKTGENLNKIYELMA